MSSGPGVTIPTYPKPWRRFSAILAYSAPSDSIAPAPQWMKAATRTARLTATIKAGSKNVWIDQRAATAGSDLAELICAGALVDMVTFSRKASDGSAIFIAQSIQTKRGEKEICVARTAGAAYIPPDDLTVAAHA